MSVRRAFAALALLAVSASPAPTHADAFPAPRGWYVPVGINLGGALHHSLPDGFLFGGEASVVHIDEGAVWAGGYVDGLWDFGADQFRFSVGPEVGVAFLGFDAGYMGMVAADDSYHHGFVARGMLSLGLLALYGRYGRTFDPGAGLGELGVLLKFPIPIAEERRSRPGLEPAYPPDAGGPEPQGPVQRVPDEPLPPPQEPSPGFATPP